MYTDPNTGSMLFYAFAAGFAAVTGILSVALRLTQTSVIRVRASVRKLKSKGNSTDIRNAD